MIFLVGYILIGLSITAVLGYICGKDGATSWECSGVVMVAGMFWPIAIPLIIFHEVGRYFIDKGKWND